MIPKHLTNPFLQSVAGDTWTPPGGAVPDLYSNVMELFKRSVEAVRSHNNSSGLLVLGEAGAGKTHLISQLRQDCLPDSSVFLVSIPLETHPGRVWRHVRERFVGDLLKRKLSPTSPLQTGLIRILTNRFPGWNPLARTGGIIGGLFAPNFERELRDHLSEYSDEHDIAAPLKRVLPKLWNSDTVELATEWLKGQSLTEVDLQKLQLPPLLLNDVDLEDQSREVVLSLCRLASAQSHSSKPTLLVICFDQVEGFAGSAQEPAGLKAFTLVVNQLLEVPGSRLIATFMRPTFFDAIFKVHVDQAYQDRIAQQKIPLPIISWEQLVKIVLARLNSSPACRAERLSRQESAFWPFSEQELRHIFDTHGQSLTPRSVIKGCAVRFNELSAGVKAANPQSPVSTASTSTTTVVSPPAKKIDATSTGPKVPAVSSATVKPIKDDIAELWVKRRDKHTKSLRAINFDDVFGAGLPWLREVLGLSCTFVDLDRRLPNVNLLFDTTQGQRRTGVAFCNHNPRSLWPRLKKLVEENKTGISGGFLQRLVLIRQESEPRSDAANGYIKTLEQAGATLLLVTNAQLAQFAAYHELVRKARNGEVTRNGLPISDIEYNNWARGHLTQEVRQFAAVVFGPLPDSEPSPPLGGKKASDEVELGSGIHLEFA